MSQGFTGERYTRSRPLRILLYVLIPASREFQPLSRSPFAFLRNRLRRYLDLATWRVTGLWRAHYSTFEDFNNSNRGDIAIRIGVRRQLEKLFGDRPLAIDEIGWGDLGKAITEAAEPYDLIVVGGGGYLFADPEGRLPPRFAADVEALERARAPVVAISVGLNHLIMPHQKGGGAFRFHPDQQAMIRRFLGRLDMISVRDEATSRALRAVGQAPPVVIDPAFLLVSTFDVERRRNRERAPGEPIAVGLNIAFHGAHATTINRRLLREIIHALQQLATAFACRFYYFVHSDSEHGIVDALRLGGLSIETVEGDVDTMLTGYKRLDIHLGQMLHSAILAMAVGVPTLAIAYDTKSAAFFELFGLSDRCIDATTLDAQSLRTAAERLMEDRHKVAAIVAARGAALRTDAAGFYKQLGDMVVEPIPARAHVLRPEPTPLFNMRGGMPGGSA